MGRERQKAAAAAGGRAAQAKLASPGFQAGDVVELVTLEDAKTCLDQIRRGVLCRVITHSEGSAASKCVAEWVRAEAAANTARLVNELRTELDARAEEVEQLRKQLAKGGVRR